MRLEKLRHLMKEDNIDGFLITQPENRRYLSGFTGSAGILVITPEKQVIATDSRYYERVREESSAWELAELKGDFSKIMLELLRSLGLGGRRVAFEAGHVTVATLHTWEQALMGHLILAHTQGFVEQLRMQKDEEELVSLKKAIALADEAFAHITRWIQPGMTEAQVAWELESYMRSHGAEGLAFDSIVASGPNGAKPHAGASDRSIGRGEPITLDFGCKVNGYCSDITRTFCLGDPADEQYLKVWNTVLDAQQAALKAAKAGLTGEAVDQVARDIIKEAGYGDYFGHGLGHGVGLAIHEGPRFSPTYPKEIQPGAVITVEPGIYIPGWGGVRIEDVVVVRDEGVDILTQAPKQPVLER
jgi:Xaa-Pro aminopeptidase